MSHEQIWAPWRLEYIKGEAPAPREVQLPDGADPQCFLCRGRADTADRENLVVARGPLSMTVLNRYPYNNGHLLVAPAAHKASLHDLSDAEHVEIQREIARFVALLRDKLAAEGFNIGLNLGKVAGAGLPGHLHWHIVPRWNGDTNFMPALAGVKVIPQSLDALWEALREWTQEG